MGMLKRLGKYGVIITLQKLTKMNKYISTEEGTGVSEHRRVAKIPWDQSLITLGGERKVGR